MDFSNDNPTPPKPDSTVDEGRSHFLETLGAGEEALNSLRQLRELAMQNDEGVVLSSQPDDISLAGATTEQPSRTPQAELPPGRVLPEIESDSDKSEPEVKPQGVAIEWNVVKQDIASLKESKQSEGPADLEISEEAPEAEIEKADISPSSDVVETEAAPQTPVGFKPVESPKTEIAPEVEKEEAAEVEAVEAPSPEEVVSEVPVKAPEAEVQPEVEAIVIDAPEKVEAIETAPPAEEVTETVVDETPEVAAEPGIEMIAAEEAKEELAVEAVSAKEKVAEISPEKPAAEPVAEEAPVEQITLACPKCNGELTLMREHLGVEGNCVWCHVPIVAAESGANGQVRIFPLQNEAAVFGPPVEKPQAKEEVAEIEPVEEVVAEPVAEPVSVEPESELPAEVIEEPKLEENVALDEVIVPDEIEIIEATPDIAPFDEAAPHDEPVEEAPSHETTFAGFASPGSEVSVEEVEEKAPDSVVETAAIDAAPVTLDPSPVSEEISEPAVSPSIEEPAIPAGFQSASPAPLVADEPEASVSNGFASPEPEPNSAFANFKDDLSAAPVELGPETEKPLTGEDATPASGDAPTMPNEFFSMASPIEVEESSSVEAPVFKQESEPTVEDEAVASGFTTPTPWGAPAEPKTEVVVEEPASEPTPGNFSAPAEMPSSAEGEGAAAPWSALPPMPPADEVEPAESKPQVEPKPTGFLERNDEADAAALSGFVPKTDIDDAPKDLPPFPSSDDDGGVSGFDVPSPVKGGGGFGSLEANEAGAVEGLPAPKPEASVSGESMLNSSLGDPAPESPKEDAQEKGFGVNLLSTPEEPAANSPFSNSPFAALSDSQPLAESEAPAKDESEEAQEKNGPPAIPQEAAPANVIPEPEGPRVESKPLGSIAPKKKAKKGFVVFMVILVGFVCGGALATFVLPVDEYVAVARSYMEAKFGVVGGESADLINLPAAMNPQVEPAPEVPPAPQVSN